MKNRCSYLKSAPSNLSNVNFHVKPTQLWVWNQICLIWVLNSRNIIVFHLQKDVYAIYDVTYTFFLFLFKKNFDIFHELIDAFCLFFFKKILVPFASLFLKPIFVFLIVSSSHFYICEKIFDWLFIHSKPLKVVCKVWIWKKYFVKIFGCGFIKNDIRFMYTLWICKKKKKKSKPI